MTPAPLPLSADRALVDPAEDRLGYAPFAKQLARSLLRGCPADGLVVALYGAWGTGKSTALNFVLHYAEQDPDADQPVIVRFNPWWFAGHEDLVRRFFSQFEAALFKWKARKRASPQEAQRLQLRRVSGAHDAGDPSRQRGEWGREAGEGRALGNRQP
jgi:predicted KAP-like P-loop ATPase